MKLNDNLKTEVRSLEKLPYIKSIEDKVYNRIQSLMNQHEDLSPVQIQLQANKSNKINKSKNQSLHTKQKTIAKSARKDTYKDSPEHCLKNESKCLNHSNSNASSSRKSPLAKKHHKIKEYENSLKKNAMAELEEQRKIRRKVIKILKDYSQCQRFFVKTKNFNEKIVTQYENLFNEVVNEKNIKNINSPLKYSALTKNPKLIVTDLKSLLSEKPPIEIILTQNLNKNELSLLKIDSKFYKKHNSNIVDENNKFFKNSSLISKLESEEDTSKEIKHKWEENRFSQNALWTLEKIENIAKEIDDVVYKKRFDKNLNKINPSESISFSNVNSSNYLSSNKSFVKSPNFYGKNLEVNQLRESAIIYNKNRNIKVSEFCKEKLKDDSSKKEKSEAINKVFIIKENFIDQNIKRENFRRQSIRIVRKRITTTESR